MTSACFTRHVTCTEISGQKTEINSLSPCYITYTPVTPAKKQNKNNPTLTTFLSRSVLFCSGPASCKTTFRPRHSAAGPYSAQQWKQIEPQVCGVRKPLHDGNVGIHSKLLGVTLDRQLNYRKCLEGCAHGIRLWKETATLESSQGQHGRLTICSANVYSCPV
ncbi:hypothetical protein ElyMa_004132800 [Elysia marginata]|uniref:Uncharacterized protein n=1 Tax=Elysia marginata TaxID=1093978 RepID=A0AAV4GFF8_9GAST|nr:hypothetical protein ElyMa_004132800 [Elysia marginata]